LQDDLAKQAEHEQTKVQAEATKRLEGHLADLRKELNGAVNRVTAEALKRKAAQIGQIKEVTEDPQSGSLTIKVEV
jgi:chromosomal replication initiation ATPase DnaA